MHSWNILGPALRSKCLWQSQWDSSKWSGLPWWLSSKNLPTMQERWVWSLDWGDSPGEGHGSALQCSCLGNPMDRGAWGATVRGVARVGCNLVIKPPPSPCALCNLTCLILLHSSIPHGTGRLGFLFVYCLFCLASIHSITSDFSFVTPDCTPGAQKGATT